MGHEVDVAPSAEEGLCLAAAARPDVLILDVRLPGMDGLTAMESFGRQIGDAPIIVITAFGDLATAVDAINKGAFEYVVKPFDVAEIRAVIERALRAEPKQPAAATADRWMAWSAALRRCRTFSSGSRWRRIRMRRCCCAEKAAWAKNWRPRRFIETAAGGMRRSWRSTLPRSRSKRLKKNCSGPRSTANASAGEVRSGLLLQAHGGTLFIDEVADIPLPLQLKLLHVLDHGEVRPVGTETTLRSRFRVISATRQELREKVEAGEFRHDLYFRLCTFEIELPPLRERRDDIGRAGSAFCGKVQQSNHGIR